MMTLLYKEMSLVAHPTSIVFAFLGCLVLVPSYPYSVIFMFGCLVHSRFTGNKTGKCSGEMPACRFLSAISTAFLYSFCIFAKYHEYSK